MYPVSYLNSEDILTGDHKCDLDLCMIFFQRSNDVHNRQVQASVCGAHVLYYIFV